VSFSGRYGHNQVRFVGPNNSGLSASQTIDFYVHYPLLLRWYSVLVFLLLAVYFYYLHVQKKHATRRALRAKALAFFNHHNQLKHNISNIAVTRLINLSIAAKNHIEYFAIPLIKDVQQQVLEFLQQVSAFSWREELDLSANLNRLFSARRAAYKDGRSRDPEALDISVVCQLSAEQNAALAMPLPQLILDLVEQLSYQAIELATPAEHYQLAVQITADNKQLILQASCSGDGFCRADDVSHRDYMIDEILNLLSGQRRYSPADGLCDSSGEIARSAVTIRFDWAVLRRFADDAQAPIEPLLRLGEALGKWLPVLRKSTAGQQSERAALWQKRLSRWLKLALVSAVAIGYYYQLPGAERQVFADIVQQGVATLSGLID
jgi:hypothetical protein